MELVRSRRQALLTVGGHAHRPMSAAPADLTGADLRSADLIGADLRDADLSGADLTGSIFLTQGQASAATGDGASTLPPALTRPAHGSSSAARARPSGRRRPSCARTRRTPRAAR
ncbi:pentapeptide repeat-containing protein [Pseudonocardia acidicola]|uniref:pentapeptide repeat-containing protein n=1 Tax=Pseudonocardia acidicola TaxID=2724939 RepID=UPI001B7D242C